MLTSHTETKSNLKPESLPWATHLLFLTHLSTVKRLTRLSKYNLIYGLSVTEKEREFGISQALKNKIFS